MQVPEGWKTGFLESGIELISGQHVDAKNVNIKGGGVPYLTGPADFPAGIIKITKYTEHGKKFCQANDILITVKGSGAGKIIKSDMKFAISRQLMAIRVIKESLII